MMLGQRSSGFRTNKTEYFNRHTWVFTMLIAFLLTGCSTGASSFQYDLITLVNLGKFPKSEINRITYSTRAAVEQNYRWDMDWLTYWKNAEAGNMCGKIRIKNMEEKDADMPVEPVDLQEVETLTVWVEYYSNTESQLMNHTASSPFMKIVEGKLIYKDGRWEVRSAKEQSEVRLPDDCVKLKH